MTNYSSGAASLFAAGARGEFEHTGQTGQLPSEGGVVYAVGVNCPYCLNDKIEVVGGYHSEGRMIRIYRCGACCTNFERTVGYENQSAG